jgi:drug/metabolite transporter (DMT)-like permease
LGALRAASVVVALVVGWAIAGETITLIQAIGPALIMTGIFYAIRDM